MAFYKTEGGKLEKKFSNQQGCKKLENCKKYNLRNGEKIKGKREKEVFFILYI